MRPFLIGVGAALLSWVLLILFTVAWLSWTRSGRMLRDPQVANENHATVQAKYGDPFALMHQAKSGQDLVALPLISVVIGVFVGLLGRDRAGWVAAAALLPLQAFLLAADSFAMMAFVRALAYLAVAYLCAWGLKRLRLGTTSRPARQG